MSDPTPPVLRNQDVADTAGRAGSDLVMAVGRTLQPAAIGLWTSEGAR